MNENKFSFLYKHGLYVIIHMLQKSEVFKRNVLVYKNENTINILT